MGANQEYLSYLNEQRTPRLKPGLLSLAPLLATVVVYPPNARLYTGIVSDPERGGAFMLAMAGTCMLIGIALAIAALSRTHRHKAPRRAAYLAAALGYILAQASFVVCLRLPASIAVQTGIVAGGIVSGACIVPVLLAWIDRFPTGLRDIMVHGAAICALSALLTWTSSLFDGTALVALLAIQCAVGTLAPAFLEPSENREDLPYTTDGKTDNEHPVTKGDFGKNPATGFVSAAIDLLSIVWLPLLGFLVFVFITNSYEFESATPVISTEATGSLIGAAIALAVCLLRYKTPLTIAVDNIAIPICIAACIALGSFPVGTPAFMLGAATVFAPLIFMATYALSCLVAIAKTGEFPMRFIVGVVLFAACAVSTLSGAVARSFAQLVNFGEVSWTIVSLYFAVVVVSLGRTAWRRDYTPDEPAVGRRQGERDASASAELRDRLLQQRIDAIAGRYGLTARERETLAYLSRGYNSTFIAQSMLISANTVRTHMYNTYRKLGVSTRDELLSLVNGDGPTVQRAET